MLNPSPANIKRRIAAMIYDLLVLLAIFIFATYLVLPFTHGHAIKPGNFWYQIYLLSICFGFYAGFWYWRGQTLGMLAWRIKLYSSDGNALKFWQVVIRFFVAIFTLSFFGIGFLWIFTNKNRRSLYDIAAKTVVVHAPN